MATMFVKQIGRLAKFSQEKMGKSTLVTGESMFAGLNSFEPGQEHALHSHQGQDKLYVMIEGSGEVHVGGQTEILRVGDVAFAPAGVPHSIRNPGPDRLVVLAVMAPPPAGK